MFVPGIFMLKTESDLQRLFLAHSEPVYQDWQYLEQNFPVEQPGYIGAVGDDNINLLEPDNLKSVVSSFLHEL